MISPSTDTLEEDIRRWVAAGSDIDDRFVIPGNKDAGSPNRLYATVLLITPSLRGTAWKRTLTVNGQTVERTRAFAEDLYSVQWFRDGARDAARRFSVWSQSEAGRISASVRSFTFMGVSRIRQIDSIISTKWEERYGLDLKITYFQTLDLPVETFAGISVELGDGVHSETVEVTL